VLLLLRSLRPFLFKYRWALIWGIVCILISNWFGIYPAQIVRHAFDEVEAKLGAAQGNPVLSEEIGRTVLYYGLLVVGAALLRGFFLFLVRQTIIVVSRKIEYEQKAQLFAKYQTYSLTLQRQRQTGDLMARISEDVSNVRMFTGPGIMYTLNTVAIFFMILVTMLLVNMELTLYVLAPLPLLSYLIYRIHSVIIKRSEAKQAQLSAVSSYTQESYAGIRLLRSYAREANAQGRFLQVSSEFKKRSMRLVLIDAFFFPLVTLLIGFSTIFTVWIGGNHVHEGNLSVGTIAEFVLYVNQLVWPVTALGWVTSLTQKAASSQKRINEMLALESELQYPDDSPAVTDAHITFRNVSYRYPNTGIQALEHLSFDVPPGGMMGVVGPTGSGKTTIVQLLLRLMDTDSGRISIDGHDVRTFSAAALRGPVGYVPQDVFLFSDTIAANIAFGKPDATPEEIQAAARFACVHEDITGFPHGYDTVVGERGVTLSGGQKQRVALARAFIKRPKLLILDDSLSAVDAATEAAILGNLRTDIIDADQRPTLIVIAHRISSVRPADHIIVLQDGSVAEEGTHEQLVAQGGLYCQLYNKQQLEEEVSAL